MLDWPLYTPSPNRECLYKVASPGKTPEKTESMFDFIPPPPTENASIKWPVQVKPLKKKTDSMLDWPLYTPSPNRECLYKVASPGKTLKKQNLCWTGHFILPPPTENASIKWPVQVKPLKKTESMFDFISPPPTENASIKWPVQVKPIKKQNLCLTLYPLPQQRMPL